jgi:uncharacterized membrane protein HdeD (DUF308 family)
MSNIISEAKGTAKNWWVFIIIGILFIIGSIWIFKTPKGSFVGLATFFSVLILISGIFSIIFAFTNKNWGMSLIGGILNLFIGIILLSYPGMTLVLFSLFVSFWLMFSGFNTIGTAMDLKKDGADNWGWVLFFGILITIFAFMAVMDPILGAGYLVYTLAISLFLLGIANFSLAFELKKINHVVN